MAKIVELERLRKKYYFATLESEKRNGALIFDTKEKQSFRWLPAFGRLQAFVQSTRFFVFVFVFAF